MMYSKDAYGSGHIFLTPEQKQAVEEGKKFSQRAYADVWAKDAALEQPAQPFEYQSDMPYGDAEELAATTDSPRYAAKMLG
ncbi:hypothetical protein [Paraburkholderia sp. DGU8]|uniref:hypothetical protein n=1 Tax=Paraburkholderia sp. DGU8 TaxID=3161997 RepID=UPI0034676FD6